MKKIDRFAEEFSFLSNMYPCRIAFEGIEFPSTEHAYQWSKTTSEEEKRKILDCVEPKKTKAIARKFKHLRPDWDTARVDIMYRLLKIKFSDPTLKEALLLTEGFELVEGNWWKDTFWGVCDGVGENHLGRLLMKVREEEKAKGNES